MKKLVNRARQVIRTPKPRAQPCPAPLQSSRSTTAEPLTSVESKRETASDECLRIHAQAQSVVSKWKSDSQQDLTSDMREMWSNFCNAGMEPENHQFLIDLLKTIVKTAGSDGAAGPWKDTSLFKLVVEQRLREVFITGQDMKAWVALNHLLRRISIPPASIYDLRMASLWNLRDVLETSTVVVTVNMLKVLMLWLGGHVHWLQLQILRAHSKSYPSDTLINLGLGDLPAITGEKLQPVVDLDRLQFWRQRLQGVHDAETSDTMMKFYASAVLSLLKVGVAEVDEWNEELPVT